MAFLDDLYAVSPPDRTVECHNIMAEELWKHARIRLNQGKTRAFNKSGEAPTRIEALHAARVDPVRECGEVIFTVGQARGESPFWAYRWAHGSSGAVAEPHS